MEVLCETQSLSLEEKLRERLWKLNDTMWKAPCRDCLTVSTRVSAGSIDFPLDALPHPELRLIFFSRLPVMSPELPHLKNLSLTKIILKFSPRFSLNPVLMISYLDY